MSILQLAIPTSGLTGLTARSFDGTTLGDPVDMSEVGSTGFYTATVPDVDGAWYVYDSEGAKIAVGVSNFGEGDRALLTDTESYARPMAKRLGLVPGVTATHSANSIVISDGDGTVTITRNGDGSDTVESA